jgi:hypothetical protein
MTLPMRRAAFTLIDLMVTLAVLAIVLIVAMPSFAPDNRTRLVAAANLFIADLNNARALSVQNPADPVRVVIAEKGAGYFLARASDPGAAIDLPTGVGGQYAVLFGEGSHADLWDVRIAPAGVDHEDIAAGALPFVAFDPFGRLSPQTDVRIEVRADGPALTIVVRGDTGDAFVE